MPILFQSLTHRSHITSAINGIQIPATQFFATIFAHLYFDSIAIALHHIIDVDTILARDVAKAVKNLNRIDKAFIRKFCDNPPERQEPDEIILPADELDERLDLINRAHHDGAIGGSQSSINLNGKVRTISEI